MNVCFVCRKPDPYNGYYQLQIKGTDNPKNFSVCETCCIKKFKDRLDNFQDWYDNIKKWEGIRVPLQ